MIEYVKEINAWRVICDRCHYQKCLIPHDTAPCIVDVRLNLIFDKGWKSDYRGDICKKCQ